MSRAVRAPWCPLLVCLVMSAAPLAAEELRVTAGLSLEDTIVDTVGSLRSPAGVCTESQVLWLGDQLAVSQITAIEGRAWSSANGEFYAVNRAQYPDGAGPAMVYQRPDTLLLSLPAGLSRLWISNDGSTVVNVADAYTGPLRLEVWDRAGEIRWRWVNWLPEGTYWSAMAPDGAAFVVLRGGMQVSVVELGATGPQLTQTELMHPDYPVTPCGRPLFMGDGRFFAAAHGARPGGDRTACLAVARRDGSCAASTVLPGRILQIAYATACDSGGRWFMAAFARPTASVAMYDHALRPVWEREARELAPQELLEQADMLSVWAHDVRADGSSAVVVGDWRRPDLPKRLILLHPDGQPAAWADLSDQHGWLFGSRPEVAFGEDGQAIHVLTSTALLRFEVPEGADRGTPYSFRRPRSGAESGRRDLPCPHGTVQWGAYGPRPRPAALACNHGGVRQSSMGSPKLPRTGGLMQRCASVRCGEL